MDTEKTGEPVFTNIDDVLAKKIISRSVENNKESASSIKQDAGETYTAKQSGVLIPIKWLVIAAAVTLLVIAALLRKCSKNA